MGFVEVYDVEKRAFFPAQVLDIQGNKCQCEFFVSGEVRQVEMQNVRLAPGAPPAGISYIDKAQIEVCCRSDQEPGGDHDLGQCWWEAEIKNIKGEFCSIHYLGYDKSFDEIVEIDHIRPASGLPNPTLHFEKHEIDVPAKLKTWVERAENLEDLKDKCGAWGLSVQKTRKGVKLSLLGTQTATDMAKMLMQLHAKHQDGLRSLENEAHKLQSEKEKRQEQYGNSVNCTFEVEERLIGAVVGAKGSHINGAIAESGVHSAYVEHNEGSSEPGKVIIHGPDRESVERCRELLEIVKETIEVDESLLGWVIGKRGATIKEMETQTGVLKARVIGNTVEIVGTKQAVMMGKLWLETHTTYLDPLNAAREEVDECYKELQNDRYSQRGKGGKGGKGSKGRAPRYFDDERDERPAPKQQPQRSSKQFKAEAAEFPDLPKPLPEANGEAALAIPKPSGKNKGKNKPAAKPDANGTAPVEAAVPRGKSRGRGRGKGSNGKGNKDVKPVVVKLAAPKEEASKESKPEGAKGEGKPQRNRARKNQGGSQPPEPKPAQ